MNHWSFVFAAYAVAGALILAMIVWVASDYRAVGQKLAELEARAARPRGGGAKGAS